MFDSFVNILREYPALAVFLTVGIGFFIGKLRVGGFSLGSVTSVLLVGVIVGQLVIPVSGPMKMFFFMMFLFSIGYSVGPDFFKSLRGSGAKQALFAVIMSSFIFAVTLGIAFLMHYTKGETIGLFSGSQTCSSLLGVGGEAISRLGLGEADTKSQLDIIPVCYAVTYIFGTLGTVVVLGNFGPKLLGGLDKVKQQTAELEKQLNSDGKDNDPAVVPAMRSVAYRCFRINAEFFSTARSTYEIERMLRDNGLQVYIDRVMHGDSIFAPRHDDLIYNGDDVVVCGRTDYMIHVKDYIGNEISNRELLDYPLERVGVVVAKKSFTGKSISSLRRTKYLHGVVIRDAVRDGKALEITAETVFRKGDRLTVLGRKEQVRKATPHIGHVDCPTISSDLMFVGLAIFIGGLFGAMCLWIGSLPLSFGTSGGSLIAGLLFGWLRSKRPTIGNISPGALWFMNNLGLNVFIAIVGIEAAPSFFSGIKAVGPLLFVVGAAGTTLPLLFGMWLGHKVFRFNPAITLGCCAGTRTCTASLGAVQDSLGSTLPAIGYTVTYAVSNILLVLWGLAAVMIV